MPAANGYASFGSTTALLVWGMLSIERVRELLGNPSLSDKELEAIRDECDAWAGLVVDAMEYSGTDWEREDWFKQQLPNEAPFDRMHPV